MPWRAKRSRLRVCVLKTLINAVLCLIYSAWMRTVRLKMFPQSFLRWVSVVSLTLTHRRRAHMCLIRSCSVMCAVANLEWIVLRRPSVAVQSAEGLPHPGHHREPGARLRRLRRPQEMMSLTTVHLHITERHQSHRTNTSKHGWRQQKPAAVGHT